MSDNTRRKRDRLARWLKIGTVAGGISGRRAVHGAADRRHLGLASLARAALPSTPWPWWWRCVWQRGDRWGLGHRTRQPHRDARAHRSESRAPEEFGESITAFAAEVRTSRMKRRSWNGSTPGESSTFQEAAGRAGNC